MKYLITCAVLCAGLLSVTEALAIIDITGIHSATLSGTPPVESPTATMDINGNAEPFTFQWSNDAPTEDIDLLNSGVHTVTVTNDFGFTNNNLLAVPLQSPYDHIRLLAGELLQSVNN